MELSNIFAHIHVLCTVHLFAENILKTTMKICDLININELSVNFDQVNFFFYTYTVGSAPVSLPRPVVVTIQSIVSFVFLAAIFYIIIYFQLNFMFLGIICPNTVCTS